MVEFHDRLRRAAAKHGLHNSYYLYRATCIFHLTNDAEAGMVEFAFEGTVLTDTDDLKTRQCDLEARLAAGGLRLAHRPGGPVWLGQSVSRAVQVEFDRYIAAGDLQKTIARMERLQKETEARGGTLGMDV